jgi:hypothetical protein
LEAQEPPTISLAVPKVRPKDEQKPKETNMAMKKKNSGKGTRKKSRNTKKEMIRFIRQGSFDKETTESLIKEIEEICAFEDSLEEF